ncbi:MAG: SpaA isopeptide-forming pilin-related protein, partial [Acidimicrobiia bacterium]
MAGLTAEHPAGIRRSWRGVVGLIGLAALLLSPLDALAQESEVVTTQLRVENEEGERIPVEGVRLEVTTLDGEPVGEAVTDADGVFEVPVSGPGEYQVTIDESTIPAGVYLRDPTRTTVTVNVLPGQPGRALFALSPTPPVDDEGQVVGGAAGVSLRAFVQLTVEGIKLGLFLAMAAIGLSLIFGTTGLVNFAHSEMIGFGMLMAYFFNFYGFAGAFGFIAGLPAPFGAGVNLIFAIVLATVFGAGLGWTLDRVVFNPLR